MKAESLIRAIDPSYRYRWEVYDSILKNLITPETRWLDAGCGMNLAVQEFPCRLNAGMDMCRHPGLLRNPGAFFVAGNLKHIPFKNGAFSLVSLNTVVEHLENPAPVFREIHRVLAPDGHLLIHTTNIQSPMIFLGKALPQRLRRLLFTRAFGALEDDIFKTYHRANTAHALKNIPGFKVVEFHAVQDINRTRRSVFLVLLGYHLVSLLPGLRWLRTNMVVLLRKTST
jgi:SAM-dependent methyltransferase